MKYWKDNRHNVIDFIQFMKSENVGITWVSDAQLRRLFRSLPDYVASVLNSGGEFDILGLGKIYKKEKNISGFVEAWVYLTPKIKFSSHFLNKTRCKK